MKVHSDLLTVRYDIERGEYSLRRFFTEMTLKKRPKNNAEGEKEGLALEAEDVVIHPVLPEACRNAPTVDAFFKELKQADDHFSNLAEMASAEGKVLRMVASLENGVASIGLQSVDPTHPFYQLSGSDNMIVFTSERYKDRPLVVRGPGAGEEVTAAGIFSEIIKIGNYLN